MSEPVHIISLGAGVQSSTMALMAAKGEITPMPKCAIFADTQAEPESVYRWLDWLEKQLPFPVHRVTSGNLWADSMIVRRSRKTGKLYLKAKIPAFVKNPNGSIGLLGRKCTEDFKIIPIQRKVKELIGVKRGPADIRCIMLIGISLDEAHRMKDSKVPYIKNSYPLIDLRMTRQECLNWVTRNGYPTPPRSACVFCPFHGDEEYRSMKENHPADFLRAVQFERELQSAARGQEVLRGVPFLHGTCEPLDTIDFKSMPSYGQISLFGNECEGMCGV